MKSKWNRIVPFIEHSTNNRYHAWLWFLTPQILLVLMLCYSIKVLSWFTQKNRGNLLTGNVQNRLERKQTWNNPFGWEKWSLWIVRHAKASFPEFTKSRERASLCIINFPRFIKQICIKGSHSYSLSSQKLLCPVIPNQWQGVWKTVNCHSILKFKIV